MMYNGNCYTVVPLHLPLSRRCLCLQQSSYISQVTPICSTLTRVMIDIIFSFKNLCVRLGLSECERCGSVCTFLCVLRGQRWRLRQHMWWLPCCIALRASWQCHLGLWWYWSKHALTLPNCNSTMSAWEHKKHHWILAVDPRTLWIQTLEFT